LAAASTAHPIKTRLSRIKKIFLIISSFQNNRGQGIGWRR